MPLSESFSVHHGHLSQNLYRTRWFDLGLRAAAFVPRPLLRGLGGCCAWIFALTHPERRGIVRKNVALAVGADAAERVSLQVYRNFGRTMADYFYAGSRTKEKALELIEDRIGYDHLLAAHRQGKGVLLLTAHLSFFELGGLVMTDLGFSTTALTVPEPDDSLTRWRGDYRKRWGVDTLEVGGDPFALAALRAELNLGKFVVALIDRPLGSNPAAVRMPHGSLPCASGILYLAMLTGCPIVVVATTEKENGKYRVEAFEPMNLEKGRPDAARMASGAQRVMDLLTPVIVRHAPSWFQFAPLGGK